MKTSKSYKKALDDGFISSAILGEVIYSYNKRAKNMRDNAKKVRDIHKYNRYFCDKYGSEERYESKKEHYYDCKDRLLKFANPIAIHSVKRERVSKIFDWQRGFEEASEKYDVYEFYDRNCDWHEYALVEESFTEYYLFYQIGNFTFHHPINESEIANQSQLEITDIGDLQTYGTETSDLLSVQFCDKVLKGLEEKTLSLAA